MRATTSLLICVVVLSTGCRPSKTSPLGPAANEERKARKIPIIPDHWNCRGGGSEAHWGNPAFADPETTHNPMHASKEVFLDHQGRLYREYDYYYSGEVFPSKHQSGRFVSESLTIVYDYEAARAGKNPWQCEVSCGSHYRDATRAGELSGQVTFEEAEAILKEWGISRLNY